MISPLSRQSVHRAVEAAQLKCVLVTKVSAHECFGKLGNRRADAQTLIQAWNVVTA